jgi:hypothetical protein
MYSFGAIVLGAAALTRLVAAQSLAFTNTTYAATVGQATTVTYTASNLDDAVEIILRKGDSNNLETIATLTDDTTGGTFTWTPFLSLSPGTDYALQINQGDETNYTPLFPITAPDHTVPTNSTTTTPPTSPTSIATNRTTTHLSTTHSIPLSTAGTASGNPSGTPGQNSTIHSATLPSTGQRSTVTSTAAGSRTANPVGTSGTGSGAGGASATASTGDAAGVRVGGFIAALGGLGAFFAGVL